jgi:predicted ATPase
VRHIEELHRYVIELEMQDGRRFTSRVLSDGTLRLLALLALQYDPDQASVVCLEEPENGVHPRRLATVVELLKGMTTDLSGQALTPSDPHPEPLKQVLVNTHSPQLVDALTAEDLILVEESTRIEAGAPPQRCTRYRPVLARSEWGPLFNGATDEPTKARVHQQLDERELGELWTAGALGGVP